MANKTIWKIRNAEGALVAQTLYAEDAAAMAALTGDGARVVFDHFLTVWREGSEAFDAGASYDAARDVMHARLDAYRDHCSARTIYGGTGDTANTAARLAGVRALHKAGLAAAAAVPSAPFAPERAGAAREERMGTA